MTMTDLPPSGLVGRRRECEVLDRLVGGVLAGQSRVLVLRGEAGVGKTALLDYLATAAAGCRLARASGAEAEMELPFAGLHALCAPLLGRLNHLPRPQREALETAFGLSAGPPPDRFLVGLAVLGLVAEAAEEQPLVCIVDDAQWLDGVSAQTLAFVARRLLAERVGLVFGLRESDDEHMLEGLPELVVGGLAADDARVLLDARIPGALDERVRERILADAGGNPLALLELPRGLTPAAVAGGFGLPALMPLTSRIEHGFVRQLQPLSAEARRLLLLAAAEPVGDVPLLWRAAELLGVGREAAEPAEATGLFEIGARVRFRHPLVRSAVYRAASLPERREVHRALAGAIDPQLDPDRRAWHRAQAADGPDELVAEELERSAGRAQARGGLAAAAAFLEQATALTPDPTRRGIRALAAAEAMLRAGAFDGALELLATTDTRGFDESQRARVDLLRGQIAFASGLSSDAVPLLLKAAKRLASLNLELARETYLSAWAAAAFAEREGAGELPVVCRAARALPPVTKHPRPLDLLLDGLALLITEGRGAAAPTLRQAASVFASEHVAVEEGLRWGWLATAASFSMWDNDGARAICERQIQLVRDTGALEALPLYLVALGVISAWSGDFAGAASLIMEVDEVTAATGAHIPPFAALLLLSLRGNEAEASALIGATLDQAADTGHGAAVAEAQWAAAVLNNGLGRYEQALTAAEQASSDPLDLYPSIWALPELVEAAARHGQAELAQRALERLAATTQPSSTDVGIGIEARSRALLSEGETAERLYVEAIERLGRTRLRTELARAHLLYGEWLRGQQRRVEAREQVRGAYDLFADMGAEAFAERAGRELLAMGETARRVTTETRDVLTPQETEIARLAAEGETNPEIGARLFISPRTVEYHLRKVFTKLGISSRKELRGALAPPLAS